ncbi:MAG: metal ABC transporter permease [Candidatus Aminicenantales bacterium]
MAAFNFLLYPFLGCLLLVLIHAYFGVHILERGVIFLDLSLAQFIGLGIAVSFFFGHAAAGRYVFALIFAVAGAAVLSFSRRISRLVNIEAFIGVLYVFSLAASILILDRTPHGLEEFQAILNGNILWLTPRDILHAFAIYAVIGLVQFIFRKRFFDLSYGRGGGLFWEFLFFLSFALVLVSSVQIAGILQVFSFLVIPALIGRMFTRKPSKILVIGWSIGFLASVFGLFVSYRLDVPTAPLIIASLSIAFFVMLAVKSRRGRDRPDEKEELSSMNSQPDPGRPRSS